MSERTEPSLDSIQAWLHTFVVEPGSQSQALAAAEKRAGFEENSAESLILPSPTLAPKERIQIYRGMYLLRMQEAMEIDFPAVQWFVGEKRFEQLVARYVASYPSQSYTLDHLGRRFEEFLKESDWLDDHLLVAELARLEWSLCMAAIAHDSPALTMADLASVSEDNFLSLQLRPVPALETHQFTHQVNDLYKAWNNDEPPTRPEERETYLVCWRHELELWRMELSPEGFHFLNRLCAGDSLEESLDHTLERFKTSEEELFAAFQNWLSEGFFAEFSVRSQQ